jgi:hypothetical protein
MKIEQIVVEKLRQLPVEKQREVLEFVDSLQEKIGTKGQYRTLKGLWARLEVDISDNDIVQARRDMWASFPREGECNTSPWARPCRNMRVNETRKR